MSAGDSPGINLSQPTIRAIGSLFTALGEPKRIAILELLRGGPMIGLDIAEQMGADPKNIAHHLRILLDAGLVDREREGRSVFYAIEDWGAMWLIEQAALATADPEP